MVLRLEVELVRLAVVAQRLVVLLAAGLEVGVREVRQGEHQRAVLGLHVAQLGFHLFALIGKFFHAGKNGCGVAAGLFDGRNLLGGLVLLCLQRFTAADQVAALDIQLQDTVDLRVCVIFLCRKARFDGCCVVTNPLYINH